MPIYNVTIPNTSPLIVYNGTWRDYTDPLLTNHTSGGFHSTTEFGASASFTFNGSAVYVIGNNTINQDVYMIILDDKSIIKNGSTKSSPDGWSNILFSEEGLYSNHTHTLTIQNIYDNTTSHPGLEIEKVYITTGDNNSSTVSEVTWDDDAHIISYTDEWEVVTGSGYYMSSTHRTGAYGAQVSIKFEGNAIAVFGGTSDDHGMFSVSLDDNVPVSLSGFTTTDRPQNLLYHASGIHSGLHNVVITNMDATGRYLEIDQVVVSRWITSPALSPTTSHKQIIFIGRIIGIVGLVSAVVLIFLCFIYREHRGRVKAKVQRDHLDQSSKPMSVQGGTVIENLQERPWLNAPSTKAELNPIADRFPWVHRKIPSENTSSNILSLKESTVTGGLPHTLLDTDEEGEKIV